MALALSRLPGPSCVPATLATAAATVILVSIFDAISFVYYSGGYN